MSKQKLLEITKNLQEVIGEDLISNCLNVNGATNVYWGTAPTGRPHIAYYLAMTKLADFLKSGCSVTILFADLHAYLDNMKAPWEQLQKRTEYYEILIKGMLKSLSVPLEKLRFVRGTDYQLKENYSKSVYEIINCTSLRDATKAGCEVVKQVSDPLLCSVIYPLLQALDEEFLGVDMQFGGVDQRKIFMYAEKYLPNLRFAKRAHLMNPMIPGLTGGKMSASEENSKIDLLDSAETVKRKLKNAAEDGVLAFIKFVLLPNESMIDIKELSEFDSYEQLENNYKAGLISLDHIKGVIEKCLEFLMKNLKNEFDICGKPELIDSAYSTVKNDEINFVDVNVFQNISDFPNSLDALIIEFPEATTEISHYPLIKDQPSILWSCRSTGEPHIGYLIALRKLAKLSNRGWKVNILIEDVGGFMHSKHQLNRPQNWQVILTRGQLYQSLFYNAFQSFNGNSDNLKFIFASEYQIKKDYILLFYQSLSKVSLTSCENLLSKIYGSDNESILSNLSSIIYPCLFGLDSLHLTSTVRLVGETGFWKDMCEFTNNLADKLNLKHQIPVTVCHEMILSLDVSQFMNCAKLGAKTAPKDVTSISLCDNLEIINRKLKKAFFDPKNVHQDATLDIIDKLIWSSLPDKGFHVTRSIENGGDCDFTSLESMRNQLINDEMHPGDIKVSLAKYLSEMLADVTKDLNIAHLINSAFPVEGKKVKINKKEINPNSLNIKVARVELVQYIRGKMTFVMKSGLDSFEYISSGGSCSELTPGDHILIVVGSTDGFLGMFGSKRNGSVSIMRLVEKEDYQSAVVFDNYPVCVPNLKLSNTDQIKSILAVSNNILMVKNRKLFWTKSNSCAIDLMFQCNEDITLELIFDI